MTTEIAKSPVSRLKDVLATPSVAEQFRNCMKDNSDLFVASLIDVYGSDQYLQKCSPQSVVLEALKAATLRLPINKGLGFAYIVPYKGAASFQIGYRGYIQLAMRTGQYKYINADKIYEGEIAKADKLTGELDLSGARVSDKVVGYFAYIETINGFRKIMHGTVEEVEAHAKRYSKSYGGASSPWKTNFDEMAIKTMLRQLLGKYGIMSVEMATALNSDSDEMTPSGKLDDDLANHANREPIDITPEPGEDDSADMPPPPAAADQQPPVKEECPL